MLPLSYMGDHHLLGGGGRGCLYLNYMVHTYFASWVAPRYTIYTNAPRVLHITSMLGGGVW